MQTNVEICILDLTTWVEIFQHFFPCADSEVRSLFTLQANARHRATGCRGLNVCRRETRDYLSINIHLLRFAFRRVYPALQTRGEHTLDSTRECRARAADTHCNARVILQFNGLLKSVRYLPGDLPLNKQHTQEAHPAEEGRRRRQRKKRRWRGRGAGVSKQGMWLSRKQDGGTGEMEAGRKMDGGGGGESQSH